MRRKIDLLILLVVLIGGFFAVRNAQAIGDWWHDMRYAPPAAVSQLATDSGMSATGEKLFYRFSPQIVDKTTMVSVCSAEKLGCTEGSSIYILESSNKPEHDRNIVTAAHEMLHVAYSRLSAQQLAELEPLLEAELRRADASRIVNALKDYPQADYYNEAHSFIGSQLPNLSQQLETHFARYFNDRTKATDAYTFSPTE